MTDHLHEALAALRFNSALTPDDVWNTPPFHLEGLHDKVVRRIRASIADAADSAGPSPIGLVLQGQKGVGKTHLLGSARRAVQRVGGYFFLIELTAGKVFWDDVADAMRSELRRADDEKQLQLTLLLRRLCAAADVPDGVARAVLNDVPLTPEDLRSFLTRLRGLDERVAVECGDTIRALVLYGSDQPEIGKAYLEGNADAEDERQYWGLPRRAQPARTLVRDLSRVLALTGPCVIAIDQLDTLVNKGQDAIDEQVTGSELAQEIALIADGLMQLRETTRRTTTIVACLPNTWKQLHSIASDTVGDRFTETPLLGLITDPEVGREFVAKRFGAIYRAKGITPPHPTWPVAPSAFGADWTPRTPRELLRRIAAHAETCVYGEIRELVSFNADVPSAAPRTTAAAEPEPAYFQDFDTRFAALMAGADVVVTERNDDELPPDLVTAGLDSWIAEVGNDDLVWALHSLEDKDTRLHAGVRRTVHEELDTRELWLFRYIASSHGNRVLKRMRDACTAAGVHPGQRDRHLVLVTNASRGWTGFTTKKKLAELEQAGGRLLVASEDDLRTFSALKFLLVDKNYRLQRWLVARKPASRTFLGEVLADFARSGRESSEGGGTGPESGHQETRPPPMSPDRIELDLGGRVCIEVESLRKHAIVFAGSGSGKTVLLRRIVEECALRGVSAIVLDLNNDLARLGDAWPEPPEGWVQGDEERAADYLAGTEVVVWTPGREGGRPLCFHPLPDFAGVREDPDEFAASVEAAVARLVPHAGVAGAAKGAVRGRAVLREALAHFAQGGGRELSGFVDVLADLPEGVSTLATARVTAADLAETLRAAMINDPLLGGRGEPVDPTELLTPGPGKRARVSVISFIGLPSDEQRQGFISQLQLEVFAWAKRNPAVDRPLGGLLVLDEAQTIAPSGGWTASTQSTILLASQARKYGLGLLLATQAPKGVHNQVTGNATTQFFGRLNTPAQIAAATEVARGRGSVVGDISGLGRGHFYAVGEAFGFTLVQIPMCLSHHPASPLRVEEVLDRARASR